MGLFGSDRFHRDEDDFSGLMSGFDDFEAPAFEYKTKSEPILDDGYSGGILKHHDDFIPVDLLLSADSNGKSRTREKSNKDDQDNNK